MCARGGCNSPYNTAVTALATTWRSVARLKNRGLPTAGSATARRRPLHSYLILTEIAAEAIATLMALEMARDSEEGFHKFFGKLPSYASTL